jgi:hypothetical protein
LQGSANQCEWLCRRTSWRNLANFDFESFVGLPPRPVGRMGHRTSQWLCPPRRDLPIFRITEVHTARSRKMAAGPCYGSAHLRSTDRQHFHLQASEIRNLRCRSTDAVSTCPD